jgi:hypothetical protein
MTALLDEDCRHFLELGPGRTLTTLAREHAPEVVAMAADRPAKIAAFRRRIATASHEERLAS